jgi:cell fate regulator YaaT (PSP1 superfamily)
MDEYLIGVRLRETAPADDYKITELLARVGDHVLVETAAEPLIGEVRRPRRAVPEHRLDQLYRRVLRLATEQETRDYRERRERETRGILAAQGHARERKLPMKVVDVEMHPTSRRVTVYFGSDERVDFRELVRDLAREFRARVEMRQVGARDITRLMDGIGPCGRELCCSSHLRKFEPISVKMAKAQDMPLTDNRLLGNCGRLKCCLLYEFSTYQELRAYLPRVNTPCQASCGGGCMTGKVRSLRVLKQAVVVGFPDGTEAEVPLDQLTWEGRAHITPADPRTPSGHGGARTQDPQTPSGHGGPSTQDPHTPS